MNQQEFNFNAPATKQDGKFNRYGVTEEQWKEMANFNTEEQLKRYGTCRTKLIANYVLGDGPFIP